MVIIHAITSKFGSFRIVLVVVVVIVLGLFVRVFDYEDVDEDGEERRSAVVGTASGCGFCLRSLGPGP
jgi:hypothetical protein